MDDLKRMKRFAKWCVHHHKACDCREYKFEKMERALKNIIQWAEQCDKYYDNSNFMSIANEAKKALENDL